MCMVPRILPNLCTDPSGFAQDENSSRNRRSDGREGERLFMLKGVAMTSQLSFGLLLADSFDESI